MASNGKVLKTSVRLDAKQALRTLDQLEKKINAVHRAINRTTKESRKFEIVVRNQNTALTQSTASMNKNATAAKKMEDSYKKANTSASGLVKTLKRLAATYLGVQTLGMVIDTSDTITKAKNKFNALEGGSPQQTEDSMNKIYDASQRARVGYADMMTNVAKSMTLAGDAFNDNIDNAIAFQEIMGKAYTLSGASAGEISSSMYQMIQALGAGTLQGDELRSVREGATMAYQEIEKFAQELYNTDESLKDLASQGLITSDIVVAAVMNASDKINDKFEDTAITFEQAWRMIKNSAINSFRPVLTMLNDALNSDLGKSIVNGICVALNVLAKTLTWVFGLVSKVYNFMVDHWSVVSKILLTLAAIIGGLLVARIISMGSAIVSFGYKAMFVVGDLIFHFKNLCRIFGTATVLSNLLGISINMWTLIAIALIAAVVIALVWLADSFVDACGIIVGSVFWLGATMWNIVVGVINAIIQFLWTCFALRWINIIEWVLNVFNGGFNSFGDAVKNLLGNIISWFLSLGQVVTKIIDAIFGTNWTGGLEALKGNILKWGKNENAITLNKEAPTVLNRVSATGAYNTGYGYGASAGQWISDKVNGFTNIFSGGTTSLATDDYGSKLDDIANGVGDTAGNTGSIADSLDLAEEDLEYLRKLAEVEWKKEYTTNTITVDMSNYNTIGGDSDLDGIVTKLTDKLYEELEVFANGVYA